ncbi:Lipoprotein E precursor [Gimesia panareensis]|uniref:Lipoprotein E n=1 Tax=Gimesia panareensis TaxID=2527978 RepID=A0A518FQ41_9PLAN|nr:HAD family acid phosphatase [Gimesia panareensis]QDV18474.1 Lipoprotein E precursor [Gimesia panareensis]
MNLNDIGNAFGTFGVAFIAIIGLWHLYWLFQPALRNFYRSLPHGLMKPASRLIRGDLFSKHPIPIFVLLLVLCYGFGQIVQDMTDYLVDSVHDPSFESVFWPPYVQQSILGKENVHRYKSLLREDGSPNSLFEDLFSHQVYIQEILQPDVGLITDRLKPLHQKFLKDPLEFHTQTPSLSDSSLIESRREAEIRVINKIYYLAKNWCYQQPNYYKELEGIQRRIDFSRSCFLIASWTFVIGLIGVILILLIKRMSGQKGRPLYSLRRRLFKRFRIVTVSCILLGVVSYIGYDRSENNFNERVFGYFVTNLDLEKAHIPVPVSGQPPQVMLGANLWLQSSLEYEGVCRTIYQAAFNQINQTINKLKTGKQSPDRKPLAVVMDLDETVFDNRKFQTYLLQSGKTYNTELWRSWVRNHVDDVALVPGAEELIQRLKKLKVNVVFISNRPDSERQKTLDALEKLKLFDRDLLKQEKTLLYLQDKHADKTGRRAIVNNNYQVIAYFGDQAGDFPIYEMGLKSKTTPDIHALQQKAAKQPWGERWFMLPNPTYGDWMSPIDWKNPFAQLLSI